MSSIGKLFFFIFCIVLIFNQSFAQDNSCKTKIRETKSKFNFVKKIDSGQRWEVPVIFHIIYNKEIENLPDNAILGILATLNSDFLQRNSDMNSVPAEFRPLAANPNVNFVLAKELPSGASTTGIIRISTKKSIFNYKQRKIFLESAIVDSRGYLNVYVCNLNTNAFTPSEDNENHDGVVLDYTRIFTGSRTLTHEVGHWFDLYHIFEGGCSDRDLVKDTPGQKKHLHTRPTHPCIECDHPTMFMNFMDYSIARIFFTAGQVVRMRDFITKYKNFKP